MVHLQSLLFFDASAVIIMLVLAYLSKRLGDALKIRSYYKLLYVTAAIVALAAGTDFISGTVSAALPVMLSLGMRFAASAGAFLICMRYWKWLFSEYRKN
jgi:hypothetical protein